MTRRLVLAAALLTTACKGEVKSEVRPARGSVVPDRVLVEYTDDRAPPITQVVQVHTFGDRTWLELAIPPDVDPRAYARTLMATPGVRSAQPRFVYTADLVVNDPHYARQYAHPRTQANLAWDVELGDGVVVAVIGTGIEPDHPDLSANLWRNPAEIANNAIDDDGNGFVDDAVGWDFADDDDDPTPANPHETAVAGVIAAVGDNGVGVIGVAPGAKLMSLRIDYETVTVAQAIDYAVANGANVINLSFGAYLVTKYGTDTIVEAALRRAETAGVIVVSTVGNNGIRTPRFPAALPTVLAVAATDNRDQRAVFSNFGTWVDVAAPGVAIYTTRRGSYGLVEGTSFAAPYVAGVAALVRAQHPEWSALQVRDVVRYTGDTLDTDRFVGNSRVNAYRAVTATEPPTTFARIGQPRANETLPRGSIVQVLGTAVGDAYALEVSPAERASWTTVERGVTTRAGRLGMLDTKDLAPGSYRLRLVARTGDTTAVETIAIDVDDGFLPGFPIELDAPAIGAPQVVDLDGDGDREVVVVTSIGTVAAFHHDGTAVDGWPVSLERSNAAPPAIGDVDGDGDVEVFVTGATAIGGGRVMAWHHDGTPLAGWPVITERSVAPVVLADVDRDRDLEIIVVDGGRAAGRIDIKHGNGVSHVGWPITTSLNFESAPVVGDLDGDGELEIAISGFEDEYVLNVDGTAALGWPRSILGSSMNLAMGDVNDDGLLDLVTLQRHQVALVEASRKVHAGWPQTADVGPFSTSALADLDADGHLEVIVVSSAGSVYVFERDGAMRPGWPKTQLAPLSNGVAVADIDEDGTADVLVTANDGRIYAWRSDGEAVNGFPKRLDDAPVSAAALDDLDDDGRVDLVLVNGNQLHALALGRRYDVASIEWPSGRHDLRNSGYHPRSFGLTLTSTALGTVRIRALEATDVPHPARHDVYRDRVRIGSTTNARFADRPAPHSGAIEYRVIAVGHGGEVLARSDLYRIDPVSLFCQSNQIGTPCDDGNPCTEDDVCGPVHCGGRPAQDGRTCDDDNRCTSNDLCSAGSCVGQQHLTCPAGPCELAICEPDTGACTTSILADRTACDDGDACTVKDSCRAGTCRAGSSRVCEAAPSCRAAGVCDSAAGGCVFDRLADQTSCDDGDACTESDMCQNGSCVGEPSPMCAAPEPCGVTSPCTSPEPQPTEITKCSCRAANGGGGGFGRIVVVLLLCFRMRRKGR